jgi:hypothetical protein
MVQALGGLRLIAENAGGTIIRKVNEDEPFGCRSRRSQFGII